MLDRNRERKTITRKRHKGKSWEKEGIEIFSSIGVHKVENMLGKEEK
jgi:hypothetical protein